MKIEKLLIENFRGIQRLEVDKLGDTIIVAGQNGSGKSCIFDAIRLLKSTYGGYQQNEWQHFFGEFQIQLTGNAANLKGLFNDNTKDCVIECVFGLRDREKSYISSNLASLLEETIWQTLLPEAFQYGGYRKALFAQQFRERQPEVRAQVERETPGIKAELAETSIRGSIRIRPNGEFELLNSRLLSVIFTNYRPREIGVIDFHGAQRHYGRENVQGINLNLESSNQAYSQHSLYNYNNKYNNVKSEMAGNFVKELLAERAVGISQSSEGSLVKTLKELFEAFFPDKEFLGPQPTIDGSLAFPVRTASGAEHDLDELSSGEKEILYGYLRIRSSAPRDSIILLDEPELHLNPRLIRGLPEFYRKHLSEALQNQLWLVTHSDALIREAVGKPGFNVFHMLPSGSEPAGASQLKPLTVHADLEVVMTDLIGDLAAYRPGGKGVVFEGGGDTDFDKVLVSTLFPEELRGINLISGTNKLRVRALHEVLETAYKKGDLPTKFYAIVDRDTDAEDTGPGMTRYQWDVYHVENYLLDAGVIAAVINSVLLKEIWTAPLVDEKLLQAAASAVPAVVAHKLRQHVNSALIGTMNLGFDPKVTSLAGPMRAAIERAEKRFAAAAAILDEAALAKQEAALTTELSESIAEGTWRKVLPGREILKVFLQTSDLTIGYEVFRNLILSRMASEGHKPAGMATVVEAIRAD